MQLVFILKKIQAIVLQTRVTIRSMREYEQINKISVSARFRK